MVAQPHRTLMSVEDYLTLDRDSVDAKFIYYRSCYTIIEYVLVDTQHQAIDVYRRASKNLWTLHLFGPGDHVELASINARFPIEAFYEGTTLSDEIEDEQNH